MYIVEARCSGRRGHSNSHGVASKDGFSRDGLPSNLLGSNLLGRPSLLNPCLLATRFKAGLASSKDAGSGVEYSSGSGPKCRQATMDTSFAMSLSACSKAKAATW